MDLKTLNELEARAESAATSAIRLNAALSSVRLAEKSEKDLCVLITERDPNGPFYGYQGASEAQAMAVKEINAIINEMKPEILEIAKARIEAKRLSLLALAARRRKLIELSILKVEGFDEQE